jgi:hypothetical protein
MKWRRAYYASIIADLHKPFYSPSRHYSYLKRKDASQMYLLKSKLPVLTDEDQRQYDRLLRQLETTVSILNNEKSSPRDKVRAIQHVLAAVELVRPDIQAIWREQFIELLAIYREMARKYLKQSITKETP